MAEPNASPRVSPGGHQVPENLRLDLQLQLTNKTISLAHSQERSTLAEHLEVGTINMLDFVCHLHVQDLEEEDLNFNVNDKAIEVLQAWDFYHRIVTKKEGLPVPVSSIWSRINGKDVKSKRQKSLLKKSLEFSEVYSGPLQDNVRKSLYILTELVELQKEKNKENGKDDNNDNKEPVNPDLLDLSSVGTSNIDALGGIRDELLETLSKVTTTQPGSSPFLFPNASKDKDILPKAEDLLQDLHLLETKLQQIGDIKTLPPEFSAFFCCIEAYRSEVYVKLGLWKQADESIEHAFSLHPDAQGYTAIPTMLMQLLSMDAGKVRNTHENLVAFVQGISGPLESFLKDRCKAIQKAFKNLGSLSQLGLDLPVNVVHPQQLLERSGLVRMLCGSSIGHSKCSDAKLVGDFKQQQGTKFVKWRRELNGMANRMNKAACVYHKYAKDSSLKLLETPKGMKKTVENLGVDTCAAQIYITSCVMSIQGNAAEVAELMKEEVLATLVSVTTKWGLYQCMKAGSLAHSMTQGLLHQEEANDLEKAGNKEGALMQWRKAERFLLSGLNDVQWDISFAVPGKTLPLGNLWKQFVSKLAKSQVKLGKPSAAFDTAGMILDLGLDNLDATALKNLAAAAQAYATQNSETSGMMTSGGFLFENVSKLCRVSQACFMYAKRLKAEIVEGKSKNIDGLITIMGWLKKWFDALRKEHRGSFIYHNMAPISVGSIVLGLEVPEGQTLPNVDTKVDSKYRTLSTFAHVDKFERLFGQRPDKDTLMKDVVAPLFRHLAECKDLVKKLR